MISSVFVAAMAATAGQPDPLAHTFFSDCSSWLKAIEGKRGVVTGSDGWLFSPLELKHLAAGRFWGPDAARASMSEPEIADPLPAILDFKEQLEAAGIELLVVPVPSRALVYPEKLSATYAPGDGGVPRLDVHHQEFYALLRERGVAVYDPWPDLVAARDDPHGDSFCRRDHHWSGVGVVAAARRIAEAIGSPEWLTARRASHGVALESEWQSAAVRGDLAAFLPGRPAPETVPLRFVGRREGGRLVPVGADQDSPLVLLGDSNVLIFHAGKKPKLADDMHAKGAGLPDQLALELGFAVDVVGVLGSGSDAARVNLRRRVAARPGYLAGKKQVVWVFNIVAFTWFDGWRKLPLGRPAFRK